MRVFALARSAAATLNGAGQPAEISFTHTITRTATGETEVIPMVGHIVAKPSDQAEIPTTQPPQE